MNKKEILILEYQHFLQTGYLRLYMASPLNILPAKAQK